MYANSEVFAWREGTVSAYRFERESKSFVDLNKQPTLGSITAHNTITRDGSTLLVANYSMGDGGPDQSVVTYGLREDGTLTAPLASIAHAGTGPNAERQERSHAHSVTEMVTGGTVIIADLGIDMLVSYPIEHDGSLRPLAQTPLAADSGPRHLAMHPGNRFVFAINELDSTILSLALDSVSGKLDVVDAKPAVPAAARESNHCADIQISPDGKFLYGSNRGHDSIAIFSVNQQNGALEFLGWTPCGGATPRNLALTASGRHLFCANQNSDRISIFARNEQSGLLTDTQHSIRMWARRCACESSLMWCRVGRETWRAIDPGLE
ncbi:lactonase family protein [Methylovirgula sp. 4M-Z18]|uniref:lactonase family protein n=1 Tax=Methylovirgula sp. 4M-Z18 TaxID=2293567 RepID=UPI001FE166F1|nr:lactonase family protein [Methylovirgula sp. 4M-Z18]